MISRIILVALLFGLSNLASANALSAGLPSYKLEGFGTLGVSHSSQKLGDYILDSTVPKGAGLSQDWFAGNDSRIGIQVSANASSAITGTLQIISEYTAEANYSPVVEWANVKYAVKPNLYVRAGRIALPTFLNSDHRKVGYSYPWIHPPLELYRQLAITNSDGVDVQYRSEYQDGVNALRLLYGGNTIDRPTSVSTSKDIWGVFDTLELRGMTIHAGYQERRSQSTNVQTGVTGNWVKNSDLSVGVSYEWGDWFAMSEWIQRKSTSKVNAMYASTGFRIREFTPYVTYSQNSPGSFVAGFAPPSANSMRLANRSQKSHSLGLRWDFRNNADFKLQYDRIKLSETSNGFLANVPSGVNLHGSSFHVISAVVDFLF